MNWSKCFWALTGILALEAPLLRADPPVGLYVFPAGGQQGTTVPAHIGGLHLNESCRLELVGDGVKAPTRIHRTTTPWFEGPRLAPREGQRQEDYPRAMAAAFTIDANAKPGSRQLLMQTSQGITAPLRFVVGTFPEVIENETSASPTMVTLPVTANGRIFPHGNIDAWSVDLKPGESLTASVAAANLDSPLLPRLEIRNDSGTVLAESDSELSPDPVLRFQAPRAGRYHVQIRDAGLKGGPAYVYRLTMTTGPWIASHFPLGGRRGEDVTLTLDGTNIPSAKVRVAIPTDADKEYGVLPVPGGNALWLDVDDLAEANEGEALAIPGIANGRIAKPGEVDSWTFTAKKGQQLALELLASKLGSLLLGTLTIVDGSGRNLTRAEPGATPTTADPTLDFAVPADGTYRIEVRDRFRSRGGPAFAYRLKLREQPPGFTLTLPAPTLTVPRGGKASFKLTIARSNSFKTPIELRFEGLPRGVTGPDKLTLKSNQAQVDLPFTATDDASITSATVKILGIAGDLQKEAVFPAMLGDAKLDNLRIAVAMPTPFRIYSEYYSAQQPRGTRYAKKFLIERTGFDGPIEVTLAEKQARHLQGVTGPTITVPAGATEFTYEVDLPPWMEIGRTCRVCVLGTARVKDADGIEHGVTYSSTAQNDQIIAVVEPGRLGLELETPTVPVKPGSSLVLGLSIQRAKGLIGAASISAVVPVSVSGVSVDSITIPSDRGQGEITVRFAPTVRGPFAPVTIRAVIATPDGPVTAEEKLILVPVDSKTP